MAIRALIFAAVSSEEQATPGKASLDEQIHECRVAIERNGWSEIGTIRVEGQSRDYTRLDLLLRDSPDFTRLVNMMERHAMHVVVCSAYDRLWRTDAIRAQLAAVARDSDVRIYSVAQPIPLDSEDAAYWLEMLSGAGAEAEIKEKNRRHRRGMRGRVQRGLHPMGQAPYGYARPKDSSEPSPQIPSEIAWVRWMYEQLLSGVAMWQIVQGLNERGARTRNGGQWWISTVRNIVTNPFYAGGVRYRHYKWSKDRKPGSKKHKCLGLLDEEIHWNGQQEPIVGREEWERVQRMLAANPVVRRETSLGGGALQGLLRCGYCQWAMTRFIDRSGVGVRCGQYNNTGGHACQCNTHRLRKIEAFVLEQVKCVLADPRAFAASLEERRGNGHNTELEALTTQLADLDKSIAGVYAAIESGRFDVATLADRYDALQAQRHALERQIHEIDARSQQVQGFEQAALSMAGVLDKLDAMPPETLARVYRLLIQAVYVRRKEPVEIKWLLG